MKGPVDPWSVLMYPQLAEKSMNIVEAENKLVFIVSTKATKADIKKAVEAAFSVKVIGVSTMITMQGQKKATVRLHPDSSASDIASRLGML
jgi:large subunit ribosomal protein L23